MSCAQNTIKNREPDVMMHENVDFDSNEEDCAYTAELPKRKSWRAENHATGYRRNNSHHSVCRENSRAMCEQSRYEMETRETRRKSKSRNQMHHCPSCYYDPIEPPPPPPSMKSSHSRTRNSGNLEASLKWCENLLVSDPSLLQSLDTTLLSPRGFSRCPPRRSVVPESAMNCRQSCGQNAQQNRRLADLMKDMVNRGLVNEDTDIRGGFTHLAPVKSILKKDSKRIEQNKEPELSMDNGNDRNDEPETDWQRLEKERRQVENDREELNKLNLEVHAYEKRKENNQRANTPIKEDGGFLEKRKSADRLGGIDEQPKPKTSGNVVSKLPVRRSAPRKMENPTAQGRGEKNDEQGKNQDSPKIEENTTYRCMPTVCRCDSCGNEETEDIESFTKNNREVEQKESRNSRYRPAFQEQSTIQSPDYKVVEEETNDERQEDQRNEEEDSFERNIYAGGDLDLRASKSYILDLIDRALSREFGTFPGEKKGDVARETSIQREIHLEGLRTFQGDYFLPPQCINQQDYVKQVKSLRWEYLNHIQEDLKTLSEIEKFLDGCTSPRQSATNSNEAFDQRGKERPKQITQQERQSTSAVL